MFDVAKVHHACITPLPLRIYYLTTSLVQSCNDYWRSRYDYVAKHTVEMRNEKYYICRIYTLAPRTLVVISTTACVKRTSNENFFLSAVFLALRMNSRGSLYEAMCNGRRMKPSRFPHATSLPLLESSMSANV